MGKYNDLDLNQWREYTDIETDSLWIIDKRDNSGVHSGYYHGNFVPQIPHQLFSRYTKKGDWILDPFMGSGTSLIEAQACMFQFQARLLYAEYFQVRYYGGNTR